MDDVFATSDERKWVRTDPKSLTVGERRAIDRAQLRSGAVERRHAICDLFVHKVVTEGAVEAPECKAPHAACVVELTDGKPTLLSEPALTERAEERQAAMAECTDEELDTLDHWRDMLLCSRITHEDGTRLTPEEVEAMPWLLMEELFTEAVRATPDPTATGSPDPSASPGE